jgi:eukaryotic-like serine/threonine-protein kinase
VTVERFRQLDAIVGAALETAPESRAEWLAARCGEDEELRREAEALLAQATDVNFLERPALAEPESGMRLGPYRLESVIGRGGMGVVYRAERDDGQYRKHVAIKILPAAFASPAAVARFEQERQILAQLDHPNIVGLLDSGLSPAGAHYVVMELVADAVPCTARRLSEDAALECFAKVCAAVQYAHQSLVVHRDLKPSNILLTPDNEPKLVDFGIAKLVDQAGDGNQTLVEQRLLTRNYASPEQVLSRPITTASDVYSLGLVLHEVLTGRPLRQWASLSLPDLLRAIEAPPEPEPTLPADLRAILRRALAADPAERYPTAAAMAADLQRYREGLPVLARGSSVWYTGWKWARRRRWILVAAAAVAVYSGFGLDAILRSSSLAAEQRQIAERERELAEAARQKAEASAMQAQAAEAAATQQKRLAEERFNDVRALARSVLFELEPAVAQLPGNTPVRKLMIEKSAAYLDRLEGSVEDSDAALHAELATAYLRLASVQGDPSSSNLGNLEGALVSIEKAIRSRRLILARSPGDANARALLADALITRAMQLNALRRGEQAQAELRAASRLLGQPGDETGLNALSRLHFAHRDYRSFLAVAERLQRQFPAKDSYHRNVALGHKYLAGGQLTRAQRLFHARQAERIDAERLVAAPDNADRKLDLSFDLSMLATLSAESGDWGATKEYFERTVAIRRELAASDPRNSRYQERLSAGLLYLGFAQLYLDNPAAANSRFEEAGTILESIATQLTPGVSQDLNALLTMGKAVGSGSCREIEAATPATSQRTARDVYGTLWARRLAACRTQ